MEKNHFEAGDVVVIKSGGPYMTITRLDEVKQLLECIWFDKTEGKHHDYFPLSALELVSFRDDDEPSETGTMDEKDFIEEDEEVTELEGEE